MFWPHVFLYTMCTPGTLLIGQRDYKMVVSCHVSPGNQTQSLWNSQGSLAAEPPLSPVGLL